MILYVPSLLDIGLRMDPEVQGLEGSVDAIKQIRRKSDGQGQILALTGAIFCSKVFEIN